MNILYLAPTPFFSVRGAPLVTHDTIRHLTSDGHDVDLLTFPFGEDIELPRLEITRCGKWLPIRSVPFGASATKTTLDVAIFGHLLWRLLKRKIGLGKAYDLVYALDESAFFCWALKWLLPCPVIYDMDASIVEQLESSSRFKWLAGLGEFAENRCVRIARIIVVQCQAYADRVAAINPNKEIVIIPDLPLVTSAEIGNAEVFSAGAELEFDSPVYLYVGNLGFHQGVDLVIGAFDRLRENGQPGSLVIAGGRPDEVERLAEKNPRVIFLGTLRPEHLPGLYRAADVVVAPRRSGSNTPMKIYDYMHSGSPIVATDLPTHTEVLDDDCAILVEATEDGLADGMTRAAKDKTLSTELADQALQKVQSITSEEIFGKGLRDSVARATGIGRWAAPS